LGDPVEWQTPSGDKVQPQGDTARKSGPGFVFGILAGMVVAALILGPVFVSSQRNSAAVSAGAKRWFSVGPDGTGRLTGWMASGAGDDGEVRDSIGYFVVGALGVQDGIEVVHSVKVYVDRDTKILVGATPLKRGEYRSSAEAVFSSDEGAFLLIDRRLTIDFHCEGRNLVADTIGASASTGENPLSAY
jgi:hypothetical protein